MNTEELLRDPKKIEDVVWEIFSNNEEKENEKVIEKLLPLINDPTLLYKIFTETSIELSNDKRKQMITDPDYALFYMRNYELEPDPEHWFGKEIVLQDPETAIYYISSYDIDIKDKNVEKMIVDYLINNFDDFRNANDSDDFYRRYSEVEYYFKLLKKKNELDRFVKEYPSIYPVIRCFYEKSFFPESMKKIVNKLEKEYNCGDL